MNWRSTLLGVATMALAAVVIFHLFQNLNGALFSLGVQPEVIGRLEDSLDDLKALARAEPERATAYRSRFDQTQTLVHRLRILEHNRLEVVRRYDFLLLGIFFAVVAAAATFPVVHQRRQERRLERLREALAQLAQGSTASELGERRRDTIGRIAVMIEETSRVMARDRRRLAQLANLSAWQEAARRHAHEMKTPLTGARLELTRLRDLVERGQESSGELRAEIRQAGEGALQEIERLAVFTREFTSFARLPHPRPERHDLASLVGEFVETFESAWPALELDFEAPTEPLPARVDRDMLRQVLVNLCDNSAHALGGESGRQRFELSMSGEWAVLEVADDGPGIPEGVRGRLFEPYTTTRQIGQGMGLGLAISKKILLDHGGDLELVEDGEKGARFRLMLPRASAETSEENAP